MRLTSSAAVPLAGAAVLAVLAGGVAYADSGSPAPGTGPGEAPTAGSADGHARPDRPLRPGAIARHTLHGEFVVLARGNPVTLDVQRGQISAVSPTSITLRSKDGFTATYAITADTKIRNDGEQATAGDLTTAERAGVVAVNNADGTTTARAIRAGQPKNAGEPAGAAHA